MEKRKNNYIITKRKAKKYIDELEDFLIVDFLQDDWSPGFLRQHFNILRQQLKLQPLMLKKEMFSTDKELINKDKVVWAICQFPFRKIDVKTRIKLKELLKI